MSTIYESPNPFTGRAAASTPMPKFVAGGASGIVTAILGTTCLGIGLLMAWPIVALFWAMFGFFLI